MADKRRGVAGDAPEQNRPQPFPGHGRWLRIPGTGTRGLVRFSGTRLREKVENFDPNKAGVPTHAESSSHCLPICVLPSGWITHIWYT